MGGLHLTWKYDTNAVYSFQVAVLTNRQIDAIYYIPSLPNARVLKLKGKVGLP